MGNFYCNFTLRGPSRDQIVRVLDDKRRHAFVSPTLHDLTIVYERESNQLNGTQINAVGNLLSKELSCTALAAANADDDELWLGLFIHGELTSEYSSRGANRGAFAMCRAFGRRLKTPIVWIVLQSPWFVFESFRHALLAKLLGIPSLWIISGYRYIERGEIPHGLSKDDLQQTGQRR